MPRPYVERRMVALADGTVVDAVLGYRAWRCEARFGEVELVSVYNQDFRWPPDGPAVVESRCNCAAVNRTYQRLMRQQFSDRCTCGIYAFSRELHHRPLSTLDGATLIHGEVYLWGVVAVHERGYRAQYAKPAAIYSSDLTAQRVKAELAADAYGVPLLRPPMIRAA